MNESITLKWGTLKGWDCTGNETMREALQRWSNDGFWLSAMAQHNTDAQKQAICDAIDACDGPIYDDWNGGTMTKDAAKKYIMEYGK